MAENIAFVAQEQFGSIVSVSQSFTEHEIEDGEPSQKIPLSSKSFRLLHGYSGYSTGANGNGRKTWKI